MNIFELLGERGDEGLAEFLERWNAARRIYKEGRFAEAIDGFAAAAALKPGDGPCAVLIDRCRRLERGGSSSPWDGTWRHDAK
jgi:adenylate cyclase